MIPEIHIEDYNYGLEDSRIAKYPLPERDASKLLHYKNGKVCEYVFRDLPDLLPANALMVFNDTKVVPARLHFQRETGAHIEIFCLEPVTPPEYNTAFAASEETTWKCVIGNAKKWKEDILSLYNPDGDADVKAMDLRAELLSRDGQTGRVRFFWKDGSPFSRVLERCGTIPIPPYLNRESEQIDAERYQTLYAKFRGSVAAPTAGLHFTQAVLDRIREKGILEETVCLHVGAGTFLPVKSSLVSEHPMHREPFVVSRKLLEELKAGNRPVVAVGTTSVRTLESLYYVGVSCLETGKPTDVDQWAPYTREYPYSTKEALGAILDWMDRSGEDRLTVGTRIIIVPGFRFRLVEKLVTNFHQPESTLILLVSAFVNGDWRTIYDFALSNDFRFLSYGDSSLLERPEA
ncbi:MAG: S-adenosylmethionine:tRNA ribosyltransferase-isomerase [Bacteroidales bacterium]|nr:S-adenosylmethionine:tRNA ribosyltransferase-isomerase [Bacteroidales bacterium]MCR4569144.1 S-adenosylmethionine:tRNA ribosyltransferase-isomerase [Bacteroidales bacterium]